MIKCSLLLDLEMTYLDGMSRQQLIEALEERCDCLPIDLRQHLAEEPTTRLRLLLFAGRLIHVLRLLQRHKRADTPLSVYQQIEKTHNHQEN
jgi:hypothetical protein